MDLRKLALAIGVTLAGLRGWAFDRQPAPMTNWDYFCAWFLYPIGGLVLVFSLVLIWRNNAGGSSIFQTNFYDHESTKGAQSKGALFSLFSIWMPMLCFLTGIILTVSGALSGSGYIGLAVLFLLAVGFTFGCILYSVSAAIAIWRNENHSSLTVPGFLSICFVSYVAMAALSAYIHKS